MGQNPAAIQIPPYSFGIHQDLPELDSEWQTFPGHYLLYASSGTFILDVDAKRWLLPPQRAAWVCANKRIRISANARITSSSVLFANGAIPPPPDDCRVFTVTPLAREMIQYAVRWGIERSPDDPQADSFFAALANVCLELAAQSEQFWLPNVRSRELTAAVDYIMRRLDQPLRADDVATAVCVSNRTLARRFDGEAHMTCGQFIHRARMLRAMEHLANFELSILEVSYSVGYESISAFNAAFRTFSQETPSQYRRRFLPR